MVNWFEPRHGADASVARVVGFLIGRGLANSCNLSVPDILDRACFEYDAQVHYPSIAAHLAKF